MTIAEAERQLTARDLEPILAVSAKLAAPFDLTTMLAEVVAAAKQVLQAERCTVWLYDREADELELRMSEDIASIRIPADKGIVGTCARTRQFINVPDCYADPRFDSAMDKRSGFRTRCMLTLPLIDHNDVLVGAMQVLNKAAGVFDATDEKIALVLAAQAAVALQRVRMTEAVIEGEKMRQSLEIARDVQMSSLPAAMPIVPGYDLYGTFEPADLTGGDTFDLTAVEQGLIVVLADATGHGIGPALAVTQMLAMLRMAFRLGADLDTAFVEANNQLGQILPPGSFITAFIGLLDVSAHRVRFQSGGQGPMLHYQARSDTFEVYLPTSFPLAAMPLAAVRPAVVIALEPGDILAIISDGIFEYHDAKGEMFGEDRVREAIREGRDATMADLTASLFARVKAFAAGAPQEDDMTVVLVKREPAGAAFPRRIEALAEVVAFTAAFFAQHAIDAQLRSTTDLALEELFTNVVKYGSRGDFPVRIALAPVPGGLEATMIAREVERFDPTRAPDAAVELPLESRKPGGLGLHLVRRLVEEFAYDYDEGARTARYRFRKTLAGGSNPGDA